MLNPEIKATWVAALRSGEYPQVKETLRSYDGRDVKGYCCLGVLCEVTKDFTKGSWVHDDFTMPIPEDKRAEYCCSDVDGCEACELSDSSGELDLFALDTFGLSSTDASNLMSMNDDEGLGFEEIADYIEENL